MAFNDAQVVALQAGSDLVPTPHGFEQVTNPIGTISATRSRLAHFAEEVYDLSAESHIVKLLKVLLGGAGVGGKQRALILCRMQQALGSTHFFDLDAFYGAILGARRNYREKLECDPRFESCGLDVWDRTQIRDGEYRGRVARFAAALQRGCTVEGIRGVAEAMLGERCDIFEGWMHPITAFRSWASTDTFTWAQTDTMSWLDMEYDATAGIPVARNLITLRPSIPLDLGEIYDLERALDRIKPASSFVDVVPSIGSHAQTLPVKVYADSSRWDVRQEVRNVRFNGLLLSPNDPEGVFIPTQVPAWARYQGEAWSLLVSGPKTVAWTTPQYPVANKTVDPTAVQIPPQQVQIDGKPVSFVSEYALLDIQKIMAGRAASESIVSELPFARRAVDDPMPSTLMVSNSTPAVRDSTVTNTATLTIDGLAMIGQATTPPSLVRQATFWCSPQRAPTSTTVDALEVRFDKDVTVNKFSMKVSNFPATVTLEYWNAVTGRWGRLGRTTINRAVPYMITGAMVPGDLHPQHRGIGHWVPLSFDTPNVTTSLFRVLFDRIDGYGPVGTGNRQTPYSVAIRDLDIGFRLASIRSVPSAFPLEPVSTTINTWGVDIVHRLNVSSPTYVLDGKQDTAWICDAQETNDAIVNFYIDVSTANAQPSVVDELYMIPTHMGPVFNLYYSQTDPATVDVANLEVEDRPLDPTAIVGGVTPISSGDAGLLFSDYFESYIDLDANVIGFTTLPTNWWTGIQFYVTQESPGRVVLYSWGSKSVHGYNVGSIELWWDQITARIGNHQATVTMSKPPYKGQRFVAVVVVTDMIPELYVYEQRGTPPIIGDGEALSTMTVEALTGAIVSMANVETNLTTDGLVMDGVTPAAQFAYGGNALAPDASLGIDIKLQLDLPPITEPGAVGILAGSASPCGWEVKRLDPDALALQVSVGGSFQANSSAVDMTGKWWIWVRRANDTGLVEFYRAAWNGDAIPDVWEPMHVSPVPTTIGAVTTTPGTFPIGKTAKGTVRRLILGEYPEAPMSFDVYFKLYGVGDEISLVRYGSSGEADGYRLVKMAMGLGSVLPDQFALYPESYTYNTPGVGLEQPNIFLRYHPAYYGHLTDNGLSWGFMGAILEPWDGMTWAPIGQYAFTRGTIEFNEVRARFLKLEISNLIIEPYDSFTIKARKVKRVVDNKKPPLGRSTTAGAASVIQTIAIPRYPDQTEQLAFTTPGNTLSPTTGLVVRDSVQRAEIGAKAGYGFALTTWQSSSMMPLKERVGLHYYQTVLVQPTARTAYFCGFKEVRVRRRNPRDFGDTPVYFDTMLTADNIDTNKLTMNLEPGQAFTQEHATNSVMLIPQYITSKVFYSYTAVDALQIATQQTGPVQIIPDDEFSSPNLSSLSFTSPDTWHASGDAAVVWDTKVGGPRVTRDPDVITAIAVQDTPIVHPPVTPVVDSIIEEGSKNVGYGEYGGIASPLVAVSPYGTLYVGARVFCDKPIGDALYLRVYGADEATILAEQRFEPPVNVSTEVFLDYVLGSNLALEASVQVRIEQHGPNVSSWIMQALSCFDSSVLFEVSNDGGSTWMPCNDVRNRRFGVVEFPTAGSALVWKMTAYRHNYVLDAVKLRPWYFKRLGSAV